jgi:hypothetical protein
MIQPSLLLDLHNFQKSNGKNEKVVDLFLKCAVRQSRCKYMEGVTSVLSVVLWDVICGKDADIILARVPP